MPKKKKVKLTQRKDRQLQRQKTSEKRMIPSNPIPPPRFTWNKIELKNSVLVSRIAATPSFLNSTATSVPFPCTSISHCFSVSSEGVSNLSVLGIFLDISSCHALQNLPLDPAQVDNVAIDAFLEFY